MHHGNGIDVSKSSSFFGKNSGSVPRFTISEWHLDGKERVKLTEKRGMSAEKILKMSDKMKDDVTEVILRNKRQTEMRLQERISDLRQAKGELENVGAALQDELEILMLLKERIKDGIRMIKDRALSVTHKCLVLREGRLGIDLSYDAVERELEIEEKAILGAADALEEALNQTEETARSLRASLYLIGKDVEHKSSVLSIESDCLNMKETSLNLTSYHGGVCLDVSNTSVEEWARYTAEIIGTSRKKIRSARLLNGNCKVLLREVVEDLRKQSEKVHEAFAARVAEVKEAKAKLQVQHFEITRQVNEMNQNISELRTSIKEKEAFLALAHTRLEKRTHRQGIELVKDEAETRLVKEVADIKTLIARMEKMHAEAEKSLRTLLKTQIELEEAINIKNNSLKIDEVDCMGARQGLIYNDV